ncbi:hypothetical protein ACTMQS_12050 [Pseudomonas syringae pv. aptata]|nr:MULTISPECIES: hypothetical protein [unclassified Pseudomonas]MBP1084629.1 DNA-directed RNA polymerase subunit RPC12/RpoP [Pseudomonas sp. PvP007]MBP1194333.1 DNA-directed RNA polymerase subunit RPC12/RpoP [Pseudomonas sp. PvP100]
MSMQDNAVASIRLGVEDFKAAEHDLARALSSIRNLTSGLLLLFKVKLQAMSSPGSGEALLKEKVTPSLGTDGKVIWVGSGKKTVDVHTIISRFKGLGVDGVEWNLLEALTTIRNDIEHYYSVRPTSVLLETVANCFHLIQQFVPTHLGVSPVSLLGPDIWTFLTEHEAFYERERKACLESLNHVSWPSDILASATEHLSCPECRAKLMKAFGDVETLSLTAFQCTRCEATSQFGDVVSSMLTGKYFSDLYIAATQGGEGPLDLCEHCDQDSYIVEEQRCAICGDGPKAPECRQCGAPLDDEADIEEIHSDALCDHCRYLLEMD